MSQFFISFEDDLMRNFAAADRMTSMMERFGMQEGEALEHSWLNKSVETAQKRVEQRNYTWRKRVLEFDDVMNKQREVVYGYRNEVLSTETPRDLVNEIIEKVIPQKVTEFLAKTRPVIGLDSLDGLVGLLDEVFDEAPVRLAGIPRATARRT